MHSYDAIVVGLGGMGSAAAYELAARGQRVLGLERFHRAHDRGSSHGRSRITRQAYAEHPAYVPLMRRAYELWRQAERDSGRRLLTLTGGIMVGKPDSALVSGARLSAETWGLPHEVLSPDDVRRRFPTLAPGEDETGVYEPNAGFVRPEEAVLAHSELAERAGAELRYGEPVTRWEAGDDEVRVTTSEATYSAGRLVFCAGPWSPELLADLGVPLVVERQVMHWFQPYGDIASFRPGRHPVFLWEEDADTLLYGFPAHDGQDTVKAAFYHRPCVTDPETVDRTVATGEVREIAEHLADKIPSLAGRHVASQTCLYTLTPDHDFVVGAHPRHPRVIVGAGFSGHGFKFAPVIGEILADLAIGGVTPHDIALFDPSRKTGQPPT